MTAPEWLQPGVRGEAVAAGFVGVVGFAWGGRVTGGTSNERRLAMSRGGVAASMGPVRLAQAGADPEREAKLATMRAASTDPRRDAQQ